MNNKKAVIIGAGPAGLTAAYELLKKSNIKPIVIEMSEHMGGLSKTVDYRGNKIDIGGHRFFSKSDRVMNWWLDILPQQNETNFKDENIMLVRDRSSRIFYSRQLFDYPLNLSFSTFYKLGFFKTIKIGISYLYASIFQIKEEKNLEDFMINRFGRELYNTFFKSYTHKVWGVECNKISVEWGAQRIKGLSIKKAVKDFFYKKFKKSDDIKQKDIETSLISKFLYPKYGPGQMWQVVAQKIKDMGGEIITSSEVTKIFGSESHIEAISYKKGSENIKINADYFFSTMAIKDLFNAFQFEVEKDIKDIATGLPYRDFLTVGLLLKKLNIDQSKIKDNWIYIQEPDVLVGRLQIFNNWSPYLVSDESKIWVGLEYFCYETDEFWNLSDNEIKEFAIKELIKLSLIESEDYIDGIVLKSAKAYPSYFGTYKDFPKVKIYLNKIDNLFLIGRNGMHKYNNQDHAMLTAITAVENIINNQILKDNIWNVNTEKEYHENK